MKKIERRRIEKSKRRMQRRLHRPREFMRPSPVIDGSNIHYEISTKTKAISMGGIGLMAQLVKRIRLADRINARVHLLKAPFPYHESDHVLNLAFNPLCGGTALDDIELRRQDEVFLDAIGAERLPDPTTAGDFCRRFEEADVLDLLDAIDDARLAAWKNQPPEFFEQATVDIDGTLIETAGRCKEGMEYSYKGVWGYHPLLVSLANTGEVLSILNRPGNRPSHEHADIVVDGVIAFLRRAGFRRIKLRGDTDFTQTHKLDQWNAGGVEFVFGIDAHPTLKDLAENLEEKAWRPLERRNKRPIRTSPRRKPQDVKQPIVVERGFENIRLQSEQIAEFSYRPGKCRRDYRIVVVRKNLSHEKGENVLFDEIRYFFYLTNDTTSSAEEIVWSANDRCHQENLIEQLKNGVRALKAPVNTLDSNWAYMVMTALAWNLKAWLALQLPHGGRHAEQHRQHKHTLLSMEFKRFVQGIMHVPAQILKTGRTMVYRLLAWNPMQPIFYLLARAVRR